MEILFAKQPVEDRIERIQDLNERVQEAILAAFRERLDRIGAVGVVDELGAVGVAVKVNLERRLQHVLHDIGHIDAVDRQCIDGLDEFFFHNVEDHVRNRRRVNRVADHSVEQILQRGDVLIGAAVDAETFERVSRNTEQLDDAVNKAVKVIGNVDCHFLREQRAVGAELCAGVDRRERLIAISRFRIQPLRHAHHIGRKLNIGHTKDVQNHLIRFFADALEDLRVVFIGKHFDQDGSEDRDHILAVAVIGKLERNLAVRGLSLNSLADIEGADCSLDRIGDLDVSKTFNQCQQGGRVKFVELNAADFNAFEQRRDRVAGDNLYQIVKRQDSVVDDRLDAIRVQEVEHVRQQVKDLVDRICADRVESVGDSNEDLVNLRAGSVGTVERGHRDAERFKDRDQRGVISVAAGNSDEVFLR